MKPTAPFTAILLALVIGTASANSAETAPAAPAAAPSTPVTFELSVNDSTMKFSLAKMQAHPGQSITVRLKNTGALPKDAMGHNWVLLKAGADLDAYAAAAATAKPEGFLPKALADQVLATIPLLGPGETGEVTFTCPTKPGTYNYLCTFPAHAMLGMKGVLTVK